MLKSFSHPRTNLSRTTERRHLTVARAQAPAVASKDAFNRLKGLIVYRATDGTPVELVKQWGPNEQVVLAWTRSLGCPFCQELATQLQRDVKPKLDALGVNLLMVSIGTPERSKDFVHRTGFPASNLFVDPDNITYDALGLKRNVQDTFFNVATPLSLLKRAGEGGTADLMKVLDGWEPWMTPKGPYQALQQGGMFVFQGDTMMFSHYDQATGVHAEINKVLDVARTLSAQAVDCGCDTTAVEGSTGSKTDVVPAQAAADS